jgi:hypothetical protein
MQARADSPIVLRHLRARRVRERLASRWGCAALLTLMACGPTTVVRDEEERVVVQPEPAANPATEADAAAAAALRAKIASYAPVELTAELGDLPENEQQALATLIEAAKLLDPVFERQAWRGNPEHFAALAKDRSPLGAAKLELAQLMRGPWDRQDHFAPFAIDRARPAGAGFYPEDLTAEAFRAYVADHPEQKAALESLTTIVERKGDELVAVPYFEAYGEWLGPAQSKLQEAARLTREPTLQRFLRSRAEAFRTGDYYQSDKDWMDLEGRVEITIGPYETYEDELLGLKGSFEAFVTVADPAASADLARFKALLPAMEAHLPVPAEVKTKRGAESPIRVVDLVYAAGDARKAVQTIAFNLPNDERVRAEKGAKKVMLRNSIRTKYEAIMRPIAERILAAEQLPLLSADAFFDEVLFHELSHSLGPAYVGNDPAKGEVKAALGASYSALEEGKADVMGAYVILYMIELGELPKELHDSLLVTYFAGLFRSVRFGTGEAHGKGAAWQINRFLELGAATFDGETSTFRVDLPKLEAAITELVKEACMLQHAGDKAAVDALFAKYGELGESTKLALAKLEGIPVDIRPRYPLAGE